MLDHFAIISPFVSPMSNFFATSSLVVLTTSALGLWIRPVDSTVNSADGLYSVSPVTRETAAAIDRSFEQLANVPNGILTDICLDLPQWQRPSPNDQAKQLETMGRYEATLATGTVAEDGKDWWHHDAFSFTTYGLSARTDPLYLSGVWTAIDQIWDCYSDDQPERINAGDLAEVWLLNHRLVDLRWQDDHYLLTVEPSQGGLQLVQFQRQEVAAQLPINLITTDGQGLPILSGDW